MAPGSLKAITPVSRSPLWKYRVSAPLEPGWATIWSCAVGRPSIWMLCPNWSLQNQGTASWAVSWPAMVRAAAAACSWAFCQDSRRSRVPSWRRVTAASPAANTPSRPVRPKRSTTMPFSISRPRLSARAVSGITPMPTSTLSARRVSPLFSFRATPPSAGSKAVVCTSVRMRTPFCSASLCTRSAAIGCRARLQMRGAASTRVTSQPRWRAADATSRPIKPLPIMAIWRPGCRARLKAMASSRVRRLCTAGRSAPAIGSGRGEAPVASSS